MRPVNARLVRITRSNGRRGKQREAVEDRPQGAVATERPARSTKNGASRIGPCLMIDAVIYRISRLKCCRRQYAISWSDPPMALELW
jgi:hypothetical protein